MHKLRFIGSLAVLLTFSFMSIHISAQTNERPFIMPIAGDPGPDTWLFGQAYGNTVGAYNFGTAWYSAGQGLHFGLDFPMPCGTPLVAVADGEVAAVDNLSRGAGPHNLLLMHREHSVTTLYGHLLEPSFLLPGQAVQQGDVVGYSGDPDVTCDSRPHLHFEVRSLDYFTAYNPIDYIDANWHSLAIVGGYSYPLFQQDLNNARRWVTLENQPVVRFGGRRLNDYAIGWPLPFQYRSPTNPPLYRAYTPLPENATWSLRPIGENGCCWNHWWHATDGEKLYVLDGLENQRATVFGWSASEGTLQEIVSEAPPAVTSPDDTYGIYNNGTIFIRNLSDPTEEYAVNTQGNTPAINTNNTKLMWIVQSNVTLPGQARATNTIWISNLDGMETQEVLSGPGISASWLDSARLLVTTPGEGRITELSVYDTRDGNTFTLGAWNNMRNLSVAPGGGRVMFYISWQVEGSPHSSGVYTIETQPDAQPQRLPWFGGWRWRDAESVYYIPYEPASEMQTLAYYHVPSGDNRILAAPNTEAPNELYFAIMNGDWDVSADGNRIVFQNDVDHNMWLLEMSVDPQS